MKQSSGNTSPPGEPHLSYEAYAELAARLDASHRQSLAYARDIQTLYRNLQDVNRQLEEANKLKSSFLGAISHELRSPFVSLDLALQVFTRYGLEHLPEGQREQIEQLGRSLKDARVLIDNLVVFAGLLSKQGRLNLEPIDIAALARETTRLLGPMAERRELALRLEIPELLVYPAGDGERIGEALWHLLHNAIKFTPPHGQIRIRAVADESRVLVEVEDTGVGVPQDQQERIWQAFSQLADALKRGVEGLGLGLALVRYVAAAHGGDVILRSRPGVGSTFGFWLPIAGSQAEQAEGQP